MHERQWYGVLALVLAFSLAAPAGLAGQEPPVDFDARGGIAFPVGNLGDVADGAGPSFNVGVNFGLTDRFLLRVTGGADMYQGIDLGEPGGNEGLNELDVDLIHFHAGGLYYLLPPESRKVSVALTGTAGLTNFHVPRLATSVGTDAVEFELSELYFSAGGGVSLGYSVHEQVDIFLDGHTYLVFGNEEDTVELVQVVNSVITDPVDSLDTMWSVPVTAGVRLHF